jgi:hypothetical protein
LKHSRIQMDSVAGKQMDTILDSGAGQHIDSVAGKEMDRVAGQQMDTFLDSVAGQQMESGPVKFVVS